MGKVCRRQREFGEINLCLSEAALGRKVSVGANFEYFLFRPEQGRYK